MEEIPITQDKKNAQFARVSAITTTIKSLPSGAALRKFQLSDYSSKAS
jgi:hypothetical protein